MLRLVSGLLLAVLITFVGGVGSHAHAADTVPEAPSDLQALGGVLSWSDNSDNEDGFRIVIRAGLDLGDFDFESQFEVGPDTTTFEVPPEIRLGCPDRPAVSYEVTSFNEKGESEPARLEIVALCPVPTPTTEPTATAEAEPTPTLEIAPTVLPTTGNPAPVNPKQPDLLVSVALAVAFVLVGTGAYLRGRGN